MRRGIVCVALAGTAMVPNAHAAPGTPTEPPPATVWVAERVSASAESVTIHAYYRWDRRGARVTYAAVTMARGRPRPFDGMTYDSAQTDGPAAYRDGTSYGCHGGSGCDVLSGPGLTFFGLMFPKTSRQPDRIYLAVAALSPEVTLVDSPGWRIRRTSHRVRYATSDAGGAAVGAQVNAEHVERFEHASLTGGRRGSIAVGTPPCRPLHRVGYLREGYGTATLSGGTERARFDCQSSIADLTAVADAATTWRLDGPVVGVATGTTRLAVIDL